MIKSICSFDLDSHNLTDTFILLNDTETRFLRNATVAMLTKELFIESWSSSISYNDFFDQCHPSKCSITLIKRFSLLFIFTKLASIYGGFSIVLRLASPLMAKFTHKLILKRQTIV